jgi:hypothetical protein
MYANKIVQAADGGFVLAKDPGAETRLWSLVNHGFTKNFHFVHFEKAINAKINGLGAALACGNLDHVEVIDYLSFVSVCLFVCLSICQSTFLLSSAFVSACLSAFLLYSVCVSVSLSVCFLSLFCICYFDTLDLQLLYTRLSVHLSVCPSVRLSVYPSVRLSFCRSFVQP